MRGYLCYDQTVNSCDTVEVSNDYTNVTCSKQNSLLVLSSNDNESLIITGHVTTRQLMIVSMEHELSHIFSNDEINLDLLQAVNANTSLIVLFLKWDLHKLLMHKR